MQFLTGFGEGRSREAFPYSDSERLEVSICPNFSCADYWMLAFRRHDDGEFGPSCPVLVFAPTGPGASIRRARDRSRGLYAPALSYQCRRRGSILAGVRSAAETGGAVVGAPSRLP